MQLKKDLEICSSDFFYDLTDGGYLDPNKICANPDDAAKVKEAVETICEFKQSCENQIEGFIQ